MVSHPVTTRLLGLLAFVVVAWVLSINAQSPATNAWKPIIFSTPDNNNMVSSNLTTPSTQAVPSANLQEGLFENTTPVPSFSFGPAPAVDTRRRFQKKSDDRSDWVFQTPAEIMGVAPDQLSASGKQSKEGHQDNLTPLERYLERQTYTSRSKLNSSRSQNSWDGEAGQTNDDSYSLDYSRDQINTGLDDLQSSATSGQPLNAVPNTVMGNNLFGNPNQDSVWANVLGTPAPQPAPNPVNALQQQADMDQFRRMLNPGFVPAAAAVTAPDSATSFNPQINLPSANSAQPLVNPIGASFAPLSSGIGQPTPLTQLPGITSPANPQPAPTPSWAPQPAPWNSPGPQPFVVPQRKF